MLLFLPHWLERPFVERGCNGCALIQPRRSAVLLPRCPPPLLCASDDYVRERRLLWGVLAEALDVQARKRTNLELQAHAVPLAPTDPTEEKAAKAYAKAVRRAAKIPCLLVEVGAAERRITALQASLGERGADLPALRVALEEECGLGARLKNFDLDARSRSQHGRPDGFDGVVVAGPHGVPILVSPQKFSDELLRRVGRGVRRPASIPTLELTDRAAFHRGRVLGSPPSRTGACSCPNPDPFVADRPVVPGHRGQGLARAAAHLARARAVVQPARVHGDGRRPRRLLQRRAALGGERRRHVHRLAARREARRARRPDEGRQAARDDRRQAMARGRGGAQRAGGPGMAVGHAPVGAVELFALLEQREACF
eukprot:1023123-Prymnesium_polylepis.1